MELEYILVYGNHTKELDEEILGFWESENALNSPDDYLKRLSDVVFIVKIENKIAAVCSCQLRFVTELNGDFLYYRSFVSQNHRNKNIAENLLEETYNFFNPLLIFKEKDIKGIYIIFENELLNEYVRNYYHPLGGNLIGFEENGNQIRVKYFTDAKF
jgi:GNAT superfamily N-acetyltransferase